MLFFLFFIGFPLQAEPLTFDRIISLGGNKAVSVQEPGAISVTSGKMIYLTDLVQNRIVKYDDSGTLLDTKGRFGWEPGNYDRPADMVLSQNLNLFVADYNNSRLQQYDRAMNFIRVIPLQTGESGRQYYPRSVDQAPTGWLYVLEADENQLLQISPQGDMVQRLGTFSEVGKYLRNSTLLRVAPSGEIWVLAHEPGRIVVFDRFGSQKRLLEGKFLGDPVSVSFGFDKVFLLNHKNEIIILRDSKPEATIPIISGPKNPTAVNLTRQGTRLYILQKDPTQIQVWRINTSHRN